MNVIFKRDPVWLESLPNPHASPTLLLLLGGDGQQVAVPAPVLLAASPLVRSILTNLLPPAYGPCFLSLPAVTGEVLCVVVDILTTGEVVVGECEDNIEEVKEVFGMLGVDALLVSCHVESIPVGQVLDRELKVENSEETDFNLNEENKIKLEVIVKIEGDRQIMEGRQLSEGNGQKMEERQPNDQFMEEMQPNDQLMEKRQPNDQIMEERQLSEGNGQKMEEKQPNDQFMEEMQPNDQLMEKRQPNDQFMEEMQPNDQLMEKRQPNDQIMEERQPNDQIMEQRQPNDQMMEERQPNDQITEDRQPNDQIMEERQPNDQIMERQPNDQIMEERQPSKGYDQIMEESLPLQPSEQTIKKSRPINIKDKTNKYCSSCEAAFNTRILFIKHCQDFHKLRFKNKSGGSVVFNQASSCVEDATEDVEKTQNAGQNNSITSNNFRMNCLNRGFTNFTLIPSVPNTQQAPTSPLNVGLSTTTMIKATPKKQEAPDNGVPSFFFFYGESDVHHD